MSQDETKRNWEEFGPNLTDEIPSSGAFFNRNSLLFPDSPFEEFDILFTSEKIKKICPRSALLTLDFRTIIYFLFQPKTVFTIIVLGIPATRIVNDSESLMQSQSCLGRH